MQPFVLFLLHHCHYHHHHHGSVSFHETPRMVQCLTRQKRAASQDSQPLVTGVAMARCGHGVDFGIRSGKIAVGGQEPFIAPHTVAPSRFVGEIISYKYHLLQTTIAFHPEAVSRSTASRFIGHHSTSPLLQSLKY